MLVTTYYSITILKNVYNIIRSNKMRIETINGIKLAVYPQVNNIVNYGFSNLLEHKVNDVYLSLCNRYDKIEKHFNINLLTGKLSGYFQCSGVI